MRCCTGEQYTMISNLAKLYGTVKELRRERKNVSPDDYFVNAKCNHSVCPSGILVFFDLIEEI